MKKFSLLAVLVIASLLLAACGGGADLGGKSVTVAVENAYPPFNSNDEVTGEGVGWDYDTVREICKRIDCVPEFKEAAWDGIFPAMEAGEYDWLADGVTYTEERYKIVDFSVPYVTVGQVLLERADETATVDELSQTHPSWLAHRSALPTKPSSVLSSR